MAIRSHDCRYTETSDMKQYTVEIIDTVIQEKLHESQNAYHGS